MTSAASPGQRAYRLDSIDMLRGLVIVIMAIDHVRDYIVFGAQADPTSDPNVSAAMFFTRWITHYCAPVFTVLAGVSAGLMTARKSHGELGRFLLTRGLAEIVRLALARGGRAETLMGLSGLGDLVLTATSIQSRNYSLGVALGQGRIERVDVHGHDRDIGRRQPRDEGVTLAAEDPRHEGDASTELLLGHEANLAHRELVDEEGDVHEALVVRDEEKALAEKTIEEINTTLKDGSHVVTQVIALQTFWRAEDYHKDYFKKNPTAPYCELIIEPKVEKVRERFAQLVRQDH